MFIGALRRPWEEPLIGTLTTGEPPITWLIKGVYTRPAAPIPTVVTVEK